MTLSPDRLILRWLARRTHAAAVEIGTACAMAPAEVRARLVALESSRLISSRSDKDGPLGKPRRVYVVTDEGRGKAGAGAAKQA